jgi:hypothetical protein
MGLALVGRNEKAGKRYVHGMRKPGGGGGENCGTEVGKHDW